MFCLVHGSADQAMQVPEDLLACPSLQGTGNRHHSVDLQRRVPQDLVYLCIRALSLIFADVT